MEVEFSPLDVNTRTLLRSICISKLVTVYITTSVFEEGADGVANLFGAGVRSPVTEFLTWHCRFMFSINDGFSCPDHVCREGSNVVITYLLHGAESFLRR